MRKKNVLSRKYIHTAKLKYLANGIKVLFSHMVSIVLSHGRSCMTKNRLNISHISHVSKVSSAEVTQTVKVNVTFTTFFFAHTNTA